jgi:hypothetical protein
MSNGHSLQDETVQKVKGASDNFLRLLKNFKGGKKDQTARHSANNYYKALQRYLPRLFSNRWEQSSAQGLWNNFAAVWNEGDCSWTDAYKALKPLNEALQQSE